MINQFLILNLLVPCTSFQYDVSHMFYGCTFPHFTSVPIMLKKVEKLCTDDDKTFLSGVLHIFFSYQYIYEKKGINFMYYLLIIIIELFHLMGIIVAYARQCHKSSYPKSITSTLLPHKRLIYVY